jgi:hypothetical protein
MGDRREPRSSGARQIHLYGLRPDLHRRLRRLPDPAELPLGRDSERTRQALRKLAIAQYWSRTSETDDYEIPDFGPDEAQVTVVFLYGRWFVTFRDLRFPGWAPLEDRQPLLQIEVDPSKRLGLSFSPC